ncbi:MAG TPA: hypothetical protein VFU36_02905, partial [Jatrophihabitans sp.]|nr:hypothetical protein [Jatrophihabitans sp.]
MTAGHDRGSRPPVAGHDRGSRPPVAGPPSDRVAVPEAVRVLAGGEPIRPVWRNERGGLTFAVGRSRYVKWTPAGSGIDLGRESARLGWAARFVPVP